MPLSLTKGVWNLYENLVKYAYELDTTYRILLLKYIVFSLSNIKDIF